MKKQSGFTLIELVMVIVILGLLAAVALPKFANLGAGAQYNKMINAMSAMKMAEHIVRNTSIATGVENGTITLEGTAITVANGYPTADTILAASGVDSADFEQDLLFLGNRVLILWQGACAFAYIDSRWSGRPQFIGVFGAVNNTCP